MPMVIPIVIAFAGVGTGVISGIAAYAAVAGAVLSGVGALTGNKDLMRIGAVISIAGGVAGLAEGAASGAAQAAAEASDAGGGSIAASTAADGGADAAAAAPAAPGALPENGGGDLPPAPGDAAAGAAPPVGTTTPGTITQPTTTGQLAATGTNATPGSLTGAYDSAPAAGTASTETTTAGQLDPNGTGGTPGGTGDYGSSTGPGSAGTSQTTTAGSGGPLDKIVNGGKQFNQGDLQSWWQKAQGLPGSVGDFIKNNPALVKIGGDMLSSMYGPQAERLDMEKSIYERARQNLNAPIKLTYSKPKG